MPISVVTSNAINFIISTVIILVLCLFSDLGLTWYILLYPVVLLVQYVLILGISFIVSALTVYIRDLEHIIGVVLMAAFYATPIVYRVDQLPANLQIIMKLNPMTYIIDGYRDILYNQCMPDMKMLGIILLIGIAVTIVGYLIFNRLQRRFAEEL